ncbi:hypothetical protein LguiB_002851 [Lonicera macranthoides]
MDLKFKGKTWAGNIFHKFEAMYEEVDDFVSQETVKYVENQVQTVGKSVQKFCSGVVQDLLPPFLDPVKHEAQAMPQKQNDAIGTQTRSMIGFEEKSVDIDTKQSPMEWDPFDFLDPVEQVISPPTQDPVNETNSEVSSEQDGEASLYNNDTDVELIAKEEQHLSEDLSTPEYKILSDASSFSESVEENYCDGILDKISSTRLLDGDGIRSSQKEGELCTTLGSSKFGSPVSTESYNVSENSNANLPLKAEKISYDPNDGKGYFPDLSNALPSSESFPTVPCDTMVRDIGLAFSSSSFSLESNYTSTNDEVAAALGSSGIKHEHCCKGAQLEAFISPLNIGPLDDSRVYIADPCMKGIDFSDKVKLDDSCVIVDSESLCAASYRARKLTSYKKIIQDAFASRKRLTKEYKQLAIWYGDIDMESTKCPKENTAPSYAVMPSESQKPPTQDSYDSEWELL